MKKWGILVLVLCLNCARGEEEFFRLEQVSIPARAIVRGHLSNMTVQGQVMRTVETARYNVQVNKHGFLVFRSSGDLCPYIDCPVSPQNISWTFHGAVPAAAPPGRYRFQLTIDTAAQEPILQLVFYFRVREEQFPHIIVYD